MWKIITIAVGAAAIGGTVLAIQLHVFTPAPLVTLVQQQNTLAAELLHRMDVKDMEIADDRVRVINADRARDELLRQRAESSSRKPKLNPLPY